MEKKLQKPYLTNYNLLIAPNIWQGHYHILLTTFLKEFIKLNSNMDMIIKTPKRMKLNTKIVSAIYITQTIKII